MTETPSVQRFTRASARSLAALFFVIPACSADNTSTTGAGGNGFDVSSSVTSGSGDPSGSTSAAGSGGAGGDLGLSTSSASGSGSGGAPNCGNELQGVIRDFMVSHPDFEKFLGSDKGIVMQDLGPDGKPVYAGNPTTPTTSGKANFDQWYNDVQGVNMAIPLAITLMPAGGLYTFQSNAFFPIDGQGFGDEGNVHNYHFTYEINTQFEYKGGEVFTFTGDDDLFTFINGKLAIDLGGVHGAETATVDLDAMAAQLGIQIGKTYALDFFFAERHTSESNFRIDTTITCFSPPPPD